MFIGLLVYFVLTFLSKSLSFQGKVSWSSKYVKLSKTIASTSIETATSFPVQSIKVPPKVIFHESKTISNNQLSISLSQETSGFALHPTLPAKLKVEYDLGYQSDSILTKFDLLSTIENTIASFLNKGGRISQLILMYPSELTNLFHEIGLPGNNEYVQMRPFYTKCLELIKYSNSSLLFNIVGRLSHEIGNLEDAINYYTLALRENPKDAAVFRNLGSVYHQIGNLQLAFASYQQVLELDPSDIGVYLKLAYFYEDLSTRDWQDAAQNARKCYDFYNNATNSKDLSTLIRYGNFLVREHETIEAIEVYNRALQLDNNLPSLWFNKAYAEIKAKLFYDGSTSLKKALELDPSIEAAKHMLNALDDTTAKAVDTVSDQYVSELFDNYAPDYEKHGRKLKHTTPRIIREELAQLYGIDKLEIAMSNVELSTCLDASHTEAHDCDSHNAKKYNISLDVLDIGCGTGLVGYWLKDISKSITGVDLSAEMIKLARKKGVYSSLVTEPIQSYLEKADTSFDVIVASDVFQYIGDLSQLFAEVTYLMNYMNPR